MKVNKSLAVMVTLVLLLSGVISRIRPSIQNALAYAPSPSVSEFCPLTGLPSVPLALDGVELRLCTSFFTSFGYAPSFAMPDPHNGIQVATVTGIGSEGGFKEFSITAVPFGTRPSTEALPGADAQSEEVYRATLRDYREQQGASSQIGPTATFFGQQVAGLASVVDLRVDGVVARPIAITEWVVEAGDRVWIIRASQELDGESASRSQVWSLVSSLGSMGLDSPDLSVPSTSVAAVRGLLPQTSVALDDDYTPQSVDFDLPFPSWWNGDCDTNNFYAATGVSAFPLGAVYRGVKACGPRPSVGPQRWVAFFSGAVQQLEWQCPELSKRFMYLAYDIPPYLANGSQVVENCDADTNGCWLEQISNNTPGQAPQPDDILSYGSTATVGHTSVVVESNVDGNGDGTIVVMEQNNSLAGYGTLVVSNWEVIGNAGAVSGWLHAPGIPLTDVTIDGPQTGVIQEGYGFTATASPITATTPIIYVWQVAGQSPVTNTGGLSDTVSFSLSTAGTQTVTVTAANDRGAVTGTHIISIYTPTQADFSATPLAGQPPLMVVFTDTSSSSVTTWLWDFGDGMTSTARHPTHSYNFTGTFSISLTASGPGGSATGGKVNYIRVSDKPIIANFTAHPARGLTPLAVQFTDESAGIVTAWQWDFGDGITATQPDSTHVYTATGTYTVNLTVSGPDGTDTETKLKYIAVQERPHVYLPLVLRNYTPVRADFVAWPTSGLVPLTVIFNNISSGNYVASLWRFGDGITSTQTSPTHTFTTPGTYTVTLTVSDASGTLFLLGDTSTLTRTNYIDVVSCVEGIANGGFEDDGDWLIPETPYLAAYTTVITHSGGRSMRAGIVEPGDNVYSYSSVRQTVSVPTDTISATLRFWLYPMSGEPPGALIPPLWPLAASIEEAALAGDVQYVIVIDENDVTSSLVSQRTNDQAWTFYEFGDLGIYAGQTIKLQFGVYNDGADGVTAMYVDDVSLEVCSAATLP